MKNILLLSSALFCVLHTAHATVGGSGAATMPYHAAPFSALSSSPFAHRHEQALNPRTYEYRPSPQVSANVREEITRSLVALGYGRGALDARTEQQLRAFIGQTDLMRAVSSELSGRGYDPNSLATAMTYWLLTNYNIIHGRTSTDSEDAAVLRQAQALLSQQSDLAYMSDGEKQRAAEGMYWVATLQQYAYEEARAGTPGFDLNSVVADAHAALMSYGIDAYQLRLSERGLEPR